jgi:LysR family transcriptional regulator, low CO2-responsive transcriptional regulator
MKNATFRQLRVFSEVAKHLSFVRAAEALHLTPPAITMQIKELEGHVGLPLFDRHGQSGRKVALTTTGEYMLVYARRILSTLKDAEDAAAKLQRLEVGKLTIGMVSTAKYFLPRMLAEFHAEHPGIDIRLAVGNREQLVRMLQANDVDIAIMGRPPSEVATRAEPFAAHPHVFVAPLDHPLCKSNTTTVEALRNYPFISREPGAGTRAAMEGFFSAARVTPNVVMEMASNETIKQAVMAGMGLSFLSLHTLVEGAPVVRAWNVVHTLSKVLSPAAEAFRYFTLERGERFLAAQFERHAPLTKVASAAPKARKSRQAKLSA